MGYTPSRKLAVIVQVRNALEAILRLARSAGSIVFDADPVDADELVISDGVTATTYTFVDTDDGTADNVRIETVGTIAGALTPDVTGTDYTLTDDLHNDARAWYSPTTGYYIYWDGTDTWIMFDNFGVDAPDTGEGGDICWTRTNADPEGEFAASTEADGAATFSLAVDGAGTLSSLIDEINADCADNPNAVTDPRRGVWATDATVGEGDPTATLENTVGGAAGNVAVTTTGGFTVAGMTGGADGIVGPVADVDLNAAGQSVTNAHTVAATAEEIEGDVAFDTGALVAVVGIDTPVYVGASKAGAEGRSVGALAGVIITVRLAEGADSLWIDAATGGTYLVWQISE